MQNNIMVTRFNNIVSYLIEPPPEITDVQQKRQSKLLSGLLLIIILLGSISGTVQVLTISGFLPTFIAIVSAIIALAIAYVLTRTSHYLMAAIIACMTPSIASYAALLGNPNDQSAFVFLLISVLLSSILLNQWFAIGFALLNLIGILILPTLQPAWMFSVVAGKISFHIIIPALIAIAMRHRDLVEHDRRKELRDSELKFRSIFDNSVDAIGVSKSGIHIMANPAYVRMFGCDNADQFVGKSILDLIAPSHRAQILDYIHLRPTGDNIPSDYETRGLRCDGTEFDMEVHVSTYKSGGELFTVPILRNITARKQAEKELRQFKITLDGTSDCVFMFEPESLKFFYVNRGAIDQLGYAETELLQMHPYDIKPEFPEPQFRSLIAPLFDGIRSEILFETVHRHNDGHYIPVEVFLQYIAPIGEKGRFVAIVRDITQRKQAEDALHKSEALYRQAIEVVGAVPYLQSYMNAITDIHYDFIGEGIRQITGYGPEEFNLQLFDSLVEESILQGDLTQYSWEEAIRRVRTGEYPIWKCEHRLRARDGSIRWVFEAAVELYDQAGVSHGSIGMFQDITERKQIQQELEENRRRLAFLLDKSPSVIYSSKATGDFGATFIATNVASQLGYHPEDFTGNPNFWFEHIHPDDISRVLAGFHKLYEQGIYAHEYRFQHKNGHYLWMQDEMTLIRSDSGEPLEIIGAWIDITERKQAEAERENLIQELTDKNSELERFTYTVSHDLKSPLVTINGYLGYLEQDAAAGNQERLKKDTQRIQEAVNKMYRLLNELLELSRVGRIVNSPVQVQFRELVQEAMDAVRGQINAHGVVIRVQPHLPVVYVDKLRIIEALQNLLDNAMKYMGDQPQPQIEIGQRSEQNGQPVLYIRDNGMGVAPEYHERIFGLFNKLDARSEGTGVGLALVKRIIEIHGGRIWVESELGQGATFYLTLPQVAQIN